MTFTSEELTLIASALQFLEDSDRENGFTSEADAALALAQKIENIQERAADPLRDRKSDEAAALIATAFTNARENLA